MSTPSEKQTPKMTRNPQQDEETTALTPPPERSSRRVPMKYLKAILILIALLVLIILSSVNIKLSRSAEQNKTTLDSIVVALKTLDAKIESTQAELSKSIKENNSDMNVLSDRLFPKTIQMSSIQNHACALSALTVKCVGQNDHGCLGIDPSLSLEPFQETSTPITLQLSYSLIPTKVVTGESYTCILTTYKTVYCLGWNDNGQLGDNTRTDSFTPIRVRKENGSPLEDVIDIEAGLKHTCAILSSGLMYCWGAKRGKDPNSPEISNLLLGWNDEVNIDVAMMALSHLATCVVLKSNTSRVKCKGDTDISGFSFCFEHNQSFNLGQEIIKLTSGDVGNHFCALLVDGTAKCFGCNVDGQLGNGSKEHLDKFAMPVLEELSRKPLSGITDINAGFKSTCLISNGTPMCFGDNAHHQLGMAFRADGVYPHTLDVTLPADKDAVSVHVGRYTGHVVYSDNSVYAWGSNMYGTLGDGSEIGVEADTIGDELGEEAVEILFNF